MLGVLLAHVALGFFAAPSSPAAFSRAATSRHPRRCSPTTTLHAAAAAAPAASSAGGDDEGLPDESDAPEPSPSESWQNAPGLEPPLPPTKHTTQLDLTGLPAKVMGSVFKLKVTSCPPLYRRPWSRQPTSTSFSTAWAFDVKEKLLLTNSHCVTDAVVINVKKPGNSSLFKADVLGKSDYSDLALLRVPDDGFWEGVEAIRMESEDVKLGELVTVIGYPRGGEKICLTKGIVSRLHFNGEYLAIQIDAAINPGNSGGPVLNEKGDCVGIAYRKRVDRGSENIGYIIPVEVVNHFLEDFRRHGQHMGACLQGFELQDLTNNALRESVAGNHTGCLVIDVANWTNAGQHLQKDDVMLEIAGHELQNDKTVAYRDGDWLPWESLMSYLFVGDKMNVTVLRKVVAPEDEEGAALPPRSSFQTLHLSWETQKRHPILPSRPANQDYLMVGGLLVLPLSWEILDPDRSTRALRSFCECVRRVYADEEVLVLSEIFPHPINDGYLPPRLTRVLSFNDEPVRNLSHLTQMIEDCDEDWMRFRVDSNLQQTIVLDARDNNVWNATREVCQLYSVPYYKPRLGEGSGGGWEGSGEAAAAAGAATEEVPPWLRKRGGGGGGGGGGKKN